MDILIACEYSGIVRDAFIRRGHDAVSCDLLPSDSDGPHITGDVFDLLDRRWDMMIAFPPCTHLSVSGARWFPAKRADGRQQAGIDFFMDMINAPIERIAVENPVGIMSSHYRRPNQIIQPWMFGEDASKKTCLWLKNIPPLKPTDLLVKDIYSNQTPSGQNKLGPSPDRAMVRARTYRGIAEAMADQWGTDATLCQLSLL